VTPSECRVTGVVLLTRSSEIDMELLSSWLLGSIGLLYLSLIWLPSLLLSRELSRHESRSSLSTASRKLSGLIRDYYRTFNSLDCFAAKFCWDSWAASWPSQSIWERPGVAFLCDEGMRCAVRASVGGVLNMNLSSWVQWPGF